MKIHFNIFKILQHEKGKVMNSKICSSGPQHLIEKHKLHSDESFSMGHDLWLTTCHNFHRKKCSDLKNSKKRREKHFKNVLEVQEASS